MHMCVHMSTSCICMHAFLCMYMCARMYMCVRAHVRLCVHVCTCIHMCACMCVMGLHAAVPQSWSFLFPRHQSHTGLGCEGAEWGYNATISFSDSPRTTKGEREAREKAKKKEKGLGSSGWKPEAGLSPPRKKEGGEPKTRCFFLGLERRGPTLVTAAV